MKKLFGLILLLFSSAVLADTSFSDLEFGQYQIADSQWNVSACLYTSSCQIYSTNPGTMYKIPWYNGQWNWQAGQYVKFVNNGNASFPWSANVYNSDGSYAGTLGTGKIVNMGTDANGHSFFFFVGNDNNTGQLFSTNLGMSGNSGYSWTGTLNPTLAQLNSFASTGSTVPLSSGQTYTSAPPTPVYTSDITAAEQNRYNAAEARLNAISGNSIYIHQYLGGSNNIQIMQVGRNESIAGVNQQNADIVGSNNTITIRQGDPVALSGNNLIEMNVNGGNNTIALNQGYDVNGNYTGTDSAYHYQSVQVTGSYNNITTEQMGYRQYGEVNITGNTNTQTMIQTGSSQQLFSLINGNNNILNTTQTGSAGNFLDVTLSGDGNSAIVNQSGNTQNKATISITNAGGAGSVNLTQTGGQVYSISTTCVTAGGCGTVTVKQGN